MVPWWPCWIGWGVTPNGVTVFSIVPGFAAGVAVAFGWFGLACVLATMAAFADIVDGLLARRQGVSSDAGEVLDATVDRYSEFFFLAGLLVHYRESIVASVLVLAALGGGFMVSYVTVKAEAMAVPAPRGSMRRSERAIYLFFGAGFTPLAELLAGPDRPLVARNAPILFALAVVALVSNASVLRRVRAIVASIRRREAERAVPLAGSPVHRATGERADAAGQSLIVRCPRPRLEVLRRCETLRSARRPRGARGHDDAREGASQPVPAEGPARRPSHGRARPP